ncbi:hypothetical protein BDQ17DRAFT_1235029 [Cyathus striatus]|nr:hypothetical protein BDQ17DRAFT_1235029 [Cyathus striatus]
MLRRSHTASSGVVSPPATPYHKRLGVAGVANIFIKMRRLEKRANKPNHIVSSSGEPLSHPDLKEGACERKVPMEVVDNFFCVGGVNVATLLRATRNTLLEQADLMGANALVDEQWTTTVCTPKNRSSGTYKVQIHYTASATRSTERDPHRPVAVDQAKGVPGLMTILRRNDD